jgi:predicted nuclease of predicted toxin-antitoxin system
VKLLADENIEAACVNWLRSLGHDVVWGVEICQGSPDTRLLAIANRESRIVLTRDRGFGELVYAERRTALGVILVRLKARCGLEVLDCGLPIVECKVWSIPPIPIRRG